MDVYGRYNSDLTIVNGGYFMVYEPTSNWIPPVYPHPSLKVDAEKGGKTVKLDLEASDPDDEADIPDVPDVGVQPTGEGSRNTRQILQPDAF